MSGATDKRFKSFLWSQTRKAAYAETRLSVPDPTVQAEPKPAGAPPASGPVIQEGRGKGRLTPLEQAAMRMSEFCAPPADSSVPTRAPGVQPDAATGAAAEGPDWHTLHVLRQGEVSAVGTATRLGRLNVRKALNPLAAGG
jgi:hypothetical protein